MGGHILSSPWARNSLLANQRQFGVGRKLAGYLVCSPPPSHLGPSFLCPLPFLCPRIDSSVSGSLPLLISPLVYGFLKSTGQLPPRSSDCRPISLVALF